MIHVVSGLLLRDGDHHSNGHILFAKRPTGKPRPELWELPGGKIEPDESAEDALRREWREEMGVELTYVGEEVIAACTMRLDQEISLSLHEVACDQRMLTTREHTAMWWFDPNDAVRNLPCSPGFYYQFTSIVEWMSRVLPSRPPLVTIQRLL